MRRTLLVTRHEFVRHLRRPSFLITTLLLPLILGVVMLVTRQASAADPSDLQAAIAGAPIGYVDASGLLAASEQANPRRFPDEAAALAALGAGEIEGFYLFPPDYLEGGAVAWVGEGPGGPQGQVALEALARAALLRDDPQLAERLATPPTVRSVPLDGAEAEQPDAGTTDAERGPGSFFIPYGFAMILYVTIFSAASFLLQSVTEEKENRTIEVVLTSLRPLQLLSGKILGLGLLGLLQVVIWLALGLLFLSLGGTALPAGLAGGVPWTVLALAVVYFVLGYLVYGSLLAAVGATIANVREGSQLTGLLIIPCVVPLFFLGAIIERPNSLLATGLSLFPLTAPITMMIRVPLTAIAPWQIALSLAALALSAGLGLWLAARLFRAGALLAGQRLSPRAVMRALRAG